MVFRLVIFFFADFVVKDLFSGVEKIPANDGRNLKIVSYNVGLLSIRFLGIKLLEPASFINQRLKKFPKALLDLDADVILLQEIYREKWKKFVFEKVQKKYPFALYYKKNLKGLSLQNGLMVISKYPIVGHDFEEFRHKVPHEVAILNKGFQVVHIELNQENVLSIINGHNVARGFFKKEDADYIVEMKEKQIKEILDYAKKNNIDFVAGDYNCGPEFFSEVYDVFAKNGFVELFESKRPGKKFVTWDNNNPLAKNDFFPNTPDQKDDHIFINHKKFKKYDIVETKVVLDERVVSVKNLKMPISDHYGIWVEVELEK